MDSVFRTWGGTVARSPARVLAAALVLCTGCTLGLLAAEVETSPEALWAPEGSELTDERDAFVASFGPIFRIASIVVKTRGGANLLSEEVLADVWRLQQLVEAVEADGDGGTPLSDICYSPTGDGCALVSPLDFWGPQNCAEGDMRGSPSLCGPSYENLPAAVRPGAKSPLGQGLVVRNLLGGVEYAADGRSVLHAQAGLISVLLDPNRASEPIMRAWEAEFVVDVRKFRSNVVDVYVSSERSLEDEIAREGATDTVLVIVSYAIVLAFVVVTLGPGFALYGIAGMASCVVALLSSLGLLALAGVPLTPMTFQVLPFLTMGVGINGTFVFLTGRAGRALRSDSIVGSCASVEDCVANCCAAAAPSVFLAGSTNAVAFFIGCATILPGLRGFCLQAALAIVFVVALQLTAFLSLLAIGEAQRGAASRSDEGPEDSTIHVVARTDIKTDGKLGVATGIDFSSEHSAAAQQQAQPNPVGFITAVNVFYRPLFLKSQVGSWCVITLFAGLVAVAGYGASTVSMGLDIQEAVPHGSYLVGFYDALFELFPDTGPLVYVVTGAVDYASIETQARMEKLSRDFYDDPFVGAPPLDWYNDLRIWSGLLGGKFSELVCEGAHGICRIPDDDRFYEWLQQFLGTGCDYTVGEPCGRVHRANILFDAHDPTNRTILGTRIMSQYNGMTSATDFVGGMQSVRRVAANANLESYAYSSYYIFFEQYLVSLPEAVRNLLLAGLACYAICLGFFHLQGGSSVAESAGLSALVLLCLAIIVILVVGGMAAWNIKLNALSIVNLVMCFGLGVDFCVHLARAFAANHRGCRATSGEEEINGERVIQALEDVGGAILSGGLSTFFGIVVLFFAKYPVFEIYYARMYVLIIASGLLSGLLLLPALLRLLP